MCRKPCVSSGFPEAEMIIVSMAISVPFFPSHSTCVHRLSPRFRSFPHRLQVFSSSLTSEAHSVRLCVLISSTCGFFFHIRDTAYVKMINPLTQTILILGANHMTFLPTSSSPLPALALRRDGKRHLGRVSALPHMPDLPGSH